MDLPPDVALGLVAFNSPYLFGGKALHDGLTCGACHGRSGPSGAAVRLTFRTSVPDLRRSSDQGTDVASFVSHAIVSEFSGPPAAPRIVKALAALAKVLAPSSLPVSQSCTIGPAELVDVSLHLIIIRIGQADPNEVDFLIDSTRFVLGEMARASSAPTNVSREMIDDANQVLHDLSRMIDEHRDDASRERIRDLAERWERGFPTAGQNSIDGRDEANP